MNSFSFTIPQNIKVGAGSLSLLPDLAKELGKSKAYIISGPHLNKIGMVAEFQYDKGWYIITDIVEEERNVIYKSRNAQEAYMKWNVYIGRKKERPVPENRKNENNTGERNDRKESAKNTQREQRNDRDDWEHRENKESQEGWDNRGGRGNRENRENRSRDNRDRRDRERNRNREELEGGKKEYQNGRHRRDNRRGRQQDME